jgi:hypothetical protein
MPPPYPFSDLRWQLNAVGAMVGPCPALRAGERGPDRPDLDTRAEGLCLTQARTEKRRSRGQWSKFYGKAPMKSAVHIYSALALGILLIVLLVADADARGRTGSHRVGGYNSHGKGSHYVGGR